MRNTIYSYILFLSLLGQFPLISNAQKDYIPLAVENAQWVVAMGDMTSIFPVESLWEYYAKGDTIIDGTIYKKIYYRSLVKTQDPPPFTPNGEFQLRGFIRDDTIEKKVYAIDLFGSGEDFCPLGEVFLMYDFSVIGGDTVDFCLLPQWGTYIVDTMLSQNYFGMDTRVFFLSWEECYEGIGSFYGLFEPMGMPVDKTRSNPLYYTYLYYYCRQAPCGLIVSLQEQEIPADFLKIYPNPSKNTLNLKLLNKETGGEIRIFNVHGQELKRITLVENQSEYQVDISGFVAGSYFLTLSDQGIVYVREKLIVF